MKYLLSVALLLLAAALPAEPRILDWEELIPAGWPPEDLFADIDPDEIAMLEDDDPKAIEFFSRIEAVWDQAPMVAELDGEQIRLPGYAIPLEGDGERVTSFLLVPYYGACIHVPPPPRNQTVLVTMSGDRTARIRQAFATVWVTGTMTVEAGETELAMTGYTLHAEQVAPYEDSL